MDTLSPMLPAVSECRLVLSDRRTMKASFPDPGASRTRQKSLSTRGACACLHRQSPIQLDKPAAQRGQPIHSKHCYRSTLSCKSSIGPQSRLLRPALSRQQKSFLGRDEGKGIAGRQLRSCKPRVVFLAHKERGRCIVTATLVEEAQLSQAGSDSKELDSVLRRELDEHPGLVRGKLDNGFEYVILPNSTPPQRFEAHLEMHAGSVDEKENEQGIAHIVEHVTFLGSKKRDHLLGTGARSNAYTDFHHTVFHVHSPLVNTNPGDHTPMLPQVLDTLAEVAFQPEFLSTRIEKERKAVMAEAQMMNTIEYRVDCCLLKYLHQENALGTRFPIGKMDQVEQWDRSAIVGFWQKWYFPANATLYLVGEFDRSVEDCKALIQQYFGHFPAVREGEQLQPHDHFGRAQTGNGSGSGKLGIFTNGNGNSAVAAKPAKQRHAVRPPVEHIFGCGPLHPGAKPAKTEVFQHRLLQHFQLSIFCKLPVQPLQTIADLRRSFMGRIVLSVLSFRVNQRYVEADPPFIIIELDISDSSREGCAVSTLSITSEPKDWRGAVQVAVQEVRRLQKYGVTRSEMERYTMALLRDSEQAAESASCIPSLEMLDYSMESIGLDHVIMDQRQTHLMLAEWADTITAEEVNREAASLLAFASYHGAEAEVLADAEQHPERYSSVGPTRSTSVVACFPAFTDPSGESIGGAAPMQRGASMTTDKHVDPAIAPQVIEEANATIREEDIPEGAVRFELTAEEIEAAISEASTEVEAPEEVDVPGSLLPQEQVDRLIAERNPHYVPLLDAPEGSSAFPPPDPATGIVQRRLSNGMRLNYWHTANEPRAAMIRIVAAGGRASEGTEAGPSGVGAVVLGARTLSESGTMGPWRRDQVELFCLSRLLNCLLETDEEFTYMDCHCAVGNGGLQAMMELLHNFLEMPRWEESAMERAKQMFISHYRSLSKSLERATADRLLAAMLSPSRRFQDIKPAEIEALTLEGMRRALEAQLHAGNIEINVVGDFDPVELEDLVRKYLGTVAPAAQPIPRVEAPIQLQFPGPEKRRQIWHLKDSDERAAAYIAGQAPPRWGNFGSMDLTQPDLGTQLVLAPTVLPVTATTEEKFRANLVRRAHPLYSLVTLKLLQEIMNGRLFTTVRDSLGLTYDVSFEISLFDRLPVAYFVIHVTSTPAKIRDALAASLDVLRSLHSQPVLPRELLRAKRTVLTKHESDLKDNLYRVNLITHLQREEVPLKNLACIRDLPRMYETAAIEDVYEAYNRLLLDEDHIFTCIGTSGPHPLPESPSFQTASVFGGNGQQPPQNILAALLATVQAAQQSSRVADAMVQVRQQQKQDSS